MLRCFQLLSEVVRHLWQNKKLKNLKKDIKTEWTKTKDFT